MLGEKRVMKIIVAHPGKQHSFRLASALKKSGDLLYYCTTVYDKNNSIKMKVIKKLLSKDNLKRANNRKNPDLNDSEVIQIGELGGLIETLLIRIDKSHLIYEKIRKINADKFGIKVAKLAIKLQADIVIMYDSNATKGFKYLKKKNPKIIRVLDVSIAARPYLKELYSKEIDKSGNRDLYKENKSWWNENAIYKYQEEIDNADYFLAASSFVKESLIACGAREKQVLQVPYGANVCSNHIHESLHDKPLEVLYVGQVTYRKGITYLLEAIAQLSSKNINLTVVGAYNISDWYVKKYFNFSNITFLGLVTPDKMKEIYDNSDVFVIDSFAEGMAQVGIEAMACGVPVICSHNSGIDDLIVDGISGFIIPVGDVNILKERIMFFYKNREAITKIGNAGRNVALKYTWKEYEKNVIRALKSIQ